MILYNLKDFPQYIEEFVLICHEEWGSPWADCEIEKKLSEGISKALKRLENYPTLILLDNDILVGFVSLFEKDCEERENLSPWYATLYVKEQYRGNNITKKLSEAIIEKAKKMGFEKIYLKTELENFYDKYGFKYLENISKDEKIYYMDLK
jgi:N-acetylglutamate synthase and related acetyltransferases